MPFVEYKTKIPKLEEIKGLYYKIAFVGTDVTPAWAAR